MSQLRRYRRFPAFNKRQGPPQCRPQVEALEDRLVLTDGFLNPSYGMGGKTLLHVTTGDSSTYRNDVVNAVAIQPDGKVVVVGEKLADDGFGTSHNYDFGVARFNTDGTPDLTFNGTGSKTIAFDHGGSNHDEATGVAINPRTGAIVVVGSVDTNSSSGADFGIVRLTPNGNLDSSFIGNGKVTDGLDQGGGNNDMPQAVLIQPDDKIVIVGTTDVGFVPGSSTVSTTNFAVIRLIPSGSRDINFGSHAPYGFVTIGFDLANGNKNDRGYGVAYVNSTNQIVVAGTAQYDNSGSQGGDYDFAVAVLNGNDGSLDTNFNGTGKRTFGFDLGGDKQDIAHAVDVTPDNKIVVAGSADFDSSDNTHFALARLSLTGNLDSSFGNNGKDTIGFGPASANSDIAYSVKVLADDRIVVGGESHAPDTSLAADFAAARLLSNGSLDSTFGNGGKATVDFNLFSTSSDEGRGAVVQADGNIVLAGAVRGPSEYDFAVAHLGTPAVRPVGGGPPVIVITPVNGNVTGLVQINLGKVKKVGSRAKVQVTLTNNSLSTIQGPLYLTLDGLKKKVKLVGSTGLTHSLSPLGSPYMILAPGPENLLSPGESVTVQLLLSGPNALKAKFLTRLLAGLSTV